MESSASADSAITAYEFLGDLRQFFALEFWVVDLLSVDAANINCSTKRAMCQSLKSSELPITSVGMASMRPF